MITRPLGDFFTRTQLEQIATLMEQHKEDELALTVALKRYFKSFGAELEAKGLLPEYAAYAVPWAIKAQQHQAIEMN